MIYRICGLMGLFVAVALSAVAQDEKQDEPKAKAVKAPLVPAPFRAFLVTDDRYPPKTTPIVKATDRDSRDRTNKMHCLVCENGPNPVVAVFVRADPLKLDASSGVAMLAQEMNKLIPFYRADKLASFDIFLRLDGEYQDDEDRDARAQEVRDFAASVKAPNVPFGLAPMKSATIDAWGIGEADEVTVVFYRNLRIVKRWTAPADGPTAEQIKEIKDTVEAEINK